MLRIFVNVSCIYCMLAINSLAWASALGFSDTWLAQTLYILVRSCEQELRRFRRK